MENMPIYNCQVTINSGTVFTKPAQYVQQKDIYERVTCFDLKYVSHVKGATLMYSIIKLFVYDENLAESLLEHANKGDKVTNITGRLVAGATPNGNKLSYIVVNTLKLKPAKPKANVVPASSPMVESKESSALAKPQQDEAPKVQPVVQQPQVQQVQQPKAEQPNVIQVPKMAEAESVKPAQPEHPQPQTNVTEVVNTSPSAPIATSSTVQVNTMVQEKPETVKAESVKPAQPQTNVTEAVNASPSAPIATSSAVQANTMVQEKPETVEDSDKLQKYLDSLVSEDWF
ncbi:hypothetical protein [Limosilactobacillus mucosae]|uniref:Uncharacterized protein n=1 Tax=Limosilactobacillus mucosae TaxID=97478 RepID=A0AAJ1HS22_LIMMU|nr:hypothetical protein [Limosilactobacillus mucosae]MDC2828467.1 hypothetical protein [Limosilactobacillus mucosae]MDC2834365.1 hypothetical protein [Limosilactobacillus mucosae]